MDEIKNLNFMLVHEAFKREGWVMYHQFMVGNRWEKGNDIVTSYYGHYKLNGKSVSNAFLCEMLHIDVRDIQVCEAIAPHPIHSKYGQAFLAGVRWADTHPANNRNVVLNNVH